MKRHAKVKILGKVYGISYTEGAPPADDEECVELDRHNEVVYRRSLDE